MCACLPAYLFTHANHLLTYLPTHLPTRLPAHLPIEDKRMPIEPAMVFGVTEDGFRDE